MCFQYKMNERRRRNDASQQKWQTHTCIHTKQTHTHSRSECLTSALSIQPKHEWQWNTGECSRRWSLKLAFLPALDWVSHSAKQERRPRDRISQRACARVCTCQATSICATTLAPFGKRFDICSLDWIDARRLWAVQQDGTCSRPVSRQPLI